jgi:replicative DNA helicase
MSVLGSPPVGSPPHNPQVEAAVVGAMLAKTKVAAEVVGTGLEPRHFYVPAMRALYAQLVEAYYDDAPLDALTIGERSAKVLARSWGCEETEAIERVMALSRGHDGRDAAAHAGLVRRDSDYRALIELADTIHRSVGLEESEPSELAATASATAMQIATSTLLDNELVSFAELGQRYVREQRILMAARDQGIELGAYFGLPFLDDHLRGLRPTELLFIAGEPGAGKSAVSWKASQKFAERQMGKPKDRRVGALVLSLEMPEGPSGTRYTQSMTGMDGGILREGRTDQADLGRIIEAWKQRRDLPLVFNFSSNMRLSQVRALTVEAIRRFNTGLVVIDHWKYIDTDRGFRRSEDEDEAKARFLKQDLAKQLNVAVICLAHTTKGAEQREDRRPRLNDLRGSGYVAAHADFIGFVHRPFKHATGDQIDSGAVHRTDAELIWEKTRHSGEAVADFYFDPSTMHIR